MLMFIIHLLENMMTINFNEACVPNHLKIARAEKKIIKMHQLFM